MAHESFASPVITSFYPPEGESSVDFVNRCETWGFLIGGQSGYLLEQGVVQIANMGVIRREELERLFDRLSAWTERRGKYRAV
jgi:aspartate aminotransferase-like enzyme